MEKPERKFFDVSTQKLIIFLEQLRKANFHGEVKIKFFDSNIVKVNVDESIDLKKLIEVDADE